MMSPSQPHAEYTAVAVEHPSDLPLPPAFKGAPPSSATFTAYTLVPLTFLFLLTLLLLLLLLVADTFPTLLSRFLSTPSAHPLSSLSCPPPSPLLPSPVIESSSAPNSV